MTKSATLTQGTPATDSYLLDREYTTRSRPDARGAVELQDQALRIAFGSNTLLLEQRPSEWFLKIVIQVCELGDLPDNWNSYGARSIDPRTAEFVISLLQEILTENDPLPAIVPTSCGGIMLEWHEGGVDLEVDVRSKSEIHLVYEDQGEESINENASIKDIQEHMDFLRDKVK